MAYRGFTWNLTSSEAANVDRILMQSERCDHCRAWDRKIAGHIRAKYAMFAEVSPDGTSPSHGRADS